MSRRDSFFQRWSNKKRATQLGEDKPIVVESVNDLESAAAEHALLDDPEQNRATESNVIDSLSDESAERQNGLLRGTEPLASQVHAPVAGDPSIGEASVDEASSDIAEQEALEPLLTDEDMPPIATLSATSDLTGFFNRGVSATLRRAALRHVFQLPSYNVRDGLNDYDDDFTYFEPLGDTVTSDMKWHTARKERERIERERLEQEARLEEEARASETESENTASDDETDAADDKQEATDSPEELTNESSDELDVSSEADTSDTRSTESKASGKTDLNDIGTDEDSPHAEDTPAVDKNDELLPS